MDNIDEYEEYFLAVNKNKPVIMYKNMDDWKNVVKDVEKYFISRWKMYIKNTENPLIPNINMDKVKKYIDDNDIIKKTGMTSKEFIDEINKLNEFYKLNWKEFIHKPNYIKNVETYVNKSIQKNNNDPLYLSLYKHNEWIDKIAYKMISKIDYDMMEHKCSTYREKIPKKIRTKLWKQYFENSLLGNCYVCLDEIEYDNFECGHIKSVFYGGDNSLDNLRPICGICNRDMGTKNLEKYKEKFDN